MRKKNNDQNKNISFDEIFHDKRLNINTYGRDDTYTDEHHFAYEPTPYCVLDRMLENGIFNDISYLIDLGCGKGRVSFYLAQKCGIRSLGIEKEPLFYEAALKNLSSFHNSDLIQFINGPAESFNIPADADAFFFFRPFSDTILKQVISNINASYYENPRMIKLIFYYVTPEYIYCCNDLPNIRIVEDIDCRDQFNTKDPRDHFMVFKLESTDISSV